MRRAHKIDAPEAALRQENGNFYLLAQVFMFLIEFARRVVYNINNFRVFAKDKEGAPRG